VKLFSHLTETFKKLNVGPEVLEWVTGDGKDVFEKSFVVPLARRYSGVGAGFKNWQAICKIDDWHLRMALTKVYIKSDLGIKLQTAFPECFSGDKVRGPVSLSALQEVAREENVRSKNDWGNPEECLWTLDALRDLGVPCLTGCWDYNSHRTHLEYSADWILFDDSFPRPDHFGEVVEFKGEKYFVAELDIWPAGPNHRTDHWCCLVPVECIDTNS